MDATRTVYLGQFTDDRAERIVEGLDARGIAWWSKQSGAITQFFFAGEWGTRLFVDADRVEDAKAAVDEAPEAG